MPSIKLLSLTLLFCLFCYLREGDSTDLFGYCQEEVCAMESEEKPSEDVTGSTVAENQPENVGERAQNDGALTPSKKRKMKSPPGVNDDVEMEDVSQDGEEMEVEEQGQDDKEAATEGVVKEGDERETDVVKTQEGVDPSVVEGKDESVVEKSGEEKRTEKGDESDKQIGAETGQEDVGAGDHIDSDGGSEKGGTQETAKPLGKKTDNRGASKKKDKDCGFPETLEGFKYRFNEEGQLRHMETNEPYVFEVKKGDRTYNQRHYEALGEVITQEVYKLLETTVKLQKIHLPTDATESEPTSFFFMSDDACKKDKLLILINGSGAVRAGQWARSLIINHSLESGTQIPYIERGIKEGYGVMVFNTNENYVNFKGYRRPIEYNSSPTEHACYVWQNFVRYSKARRIDIVAHSYGGVVTVDLLSAFSDDFVDRVFKIAFTDSVHSLSSPRLTRRDKKWMVKHARNWVSSEYPLDTPERTYSDVPCVSAGTPKHVETSWKSFESVFLYLTDREEAVKELSGKSSRDEKKPAKDGKKSPKKKPGSSMKDKSESSSGTGSAATGKKLEKLPKKAPVKKDHSPEEKSSIESPEKSPKESPVKKDHSPEEKSSIESHEKSPKKSPVKKARSPEEKSSIESPEKSQSPQSPTKSEASARSATESQKLLTPETMKPSEKYKGI